MAALFVTFTFALFGSLNGNQIAPAPSLSSSDSSSSSVSLSSSSSSSSSSSGFVLPLDVNLNSNCLYDADDGDDDDNEFINRAFYGKRCFTTLNHTDMNEYNFESAISTPLPIIEHRNDYTWRIAHSAHTRRSATAYVVLTLLELRAQYRDKSMTRDEYKKKRGELQKSRIDDGNYSHEDLHFKDVDMLNISRALARYFMHDSQHTRFFEYLVSNFTHGPYGLALNSDNMTNVNELAFFEYATLPTEDCAGGQSTACLTKSNLIHMFTVAPVSSRRRPFDVDVSFDSHSLIFTPDPFLHTSSFMHPSAAYPFTRAQVTEALTSNLFWKKTVTVHAPVRRDSRFMTNRRGMTGKREIYRVPVQVQLSAMGHEWEGFSGYRPNVYFQQVDFDMLVGKSLLRQFKYKVVPFFIDDELDSFGKCSSSACVSFVSALSRRLIRCQQLSSDANDDDVDAWLDGGVLATLAGENRYWPHPLHMQIALDADDVESARDRQVKQWLRRVADDARYYLELAFRMPEQGDADIDVVSDEDSAPHSDEPVCRTFRLRVTVRKYDHEHTRRRRWAYELRSNSPLATASATEHEHQEPDEPVGKRFEFIGAAKNYYKPIAYLNTLCTSN